ncbi:MAG TPA: thiolase family protein [Alphaproteobacteria bacterium]|jgi:hypothetical protein|nr:thiolase family protein [Alphaproteobacteria bacterium]
MDAYVLGLAQHPAAAVVAGKRLEEMVYDTARAALDDAGVSRPELEHVTIAACDELDGRSISSMLLAAPAGAYLKDENKCTDAGLIGLCLGAMRASEFGLGLVASWNKSSKAPVEDVMRMRCEPFYTRPVGLNRAISDGLFAQAMAGRGIDEERANAAAAAAAERGQTNPRGLGRAAPNAAEIAASAFVATPLREGQRAPISDGATAFVLASESWLAEHPERCPLARIAGLGWAVDSYQLGAQRLSALQSFQTSLNAALKMADCQLGDLDVFEADAPTGYHEAGFRDFLGDRFGGAWSPAGGAFAQNPLFSTGLNNAAEAVLQVAGRAGPVQVAKTKRAAGHGSHGFAQQGNAVVVFEAV